MNTRILLGIATLLAALLYACPADGGSTSSGPAPQLNIEEEITQKDPALVYKADMHENAQVLFSKGDTDNPYLFSFKVSSVKNLEAITGEITIIGGDTVLYEETKGAKTPFGFDAHTDYQTYKTTEGMYTLDTNTVSGASIDAITDDPSYDGTTYIVGIGPTEDKPIDFDTLTDDFTVHAKILYEGEVLKEETVQVSKAGRYDVTTWRDLQHINDDLTGDYEVKNNIVFPSVGAYDYENFRPIGLLPADEKNSFSYAFSGTFEGNNHNIEGLYIDYALMPSILTNNYTIGLFGLIKVSGEIDPKGLIRNINIYHAGIHGDVGSSVGSGAGVLIGQVRIQAPLTHGHIIVNNSHVYSLDGAVIRGASGVGGLIGAIIAQGGPSKPEIKDSSAHTDVEGQRFEVGGLIGRSVGDVMVSNSYATGNVVGTDSIGGLIGVIDASNLPVVRGYATGDVTGQNAVGGIAGTTAGGVGLVGYATGRVEGDSDVGGVIGRAKWFGQWLHNETLGKIVINAYSTSNVLGEKNVGGVIGSVRTDVFSENKGKDINIIEYTGYARGKISSSTALAGLFIGHIENHEDVNDVSGYFSGTTSNFVGIKQNEATGINGNSVTISEVTNANHRAKFENFVFGDEVGQWKWEGNGKWPALNIGGTAPTADQPIAASSYTPYILGVQEEQTDKTMEGIERLKDNVFKVYETRSLLSEQKRIGSERPQVDFYPTGLYVKPNRTITVTVASDTAIKNLKVLMGTYSRYAGASWDPDAFTLKVGKNTITNTRNKPRLISIQFVERRNPVDVATVTIHGATKLPYFIRGKTTSKEFQSMLKNYDYDSVLIASNKIMMVVSKETALQVQNQDWAKTAELLDKAVEAAEYIYGLDSEFSYEAPPSTRILAIGSDSGKLIYATNHGITVPEAFAIGWIDNTQIIKDWGLWFGIGHMYQPSQILISGTTANIYSLAIERAFKQESRLVRNGTWNEIKTYLAKPAAEKKFNDLDVFIKLGMFQQLWLGYGSTDAARDKFFISLHKKIRRESKGDIPFVNDNKEALAYLMLKSSEVYGYNLNGFFRKWGFQLPQAAFDAVDELGLKNPPVDPSTLSR